MHRNRNRIVTAEKSQPISQKESLRRNLTRVDESQTLTANHRRETVHLGFNSGTLLNDLSQNQAIRARGYCESIRRRYRAHLSAPEKLAVDFLFKEVRALFEYCSACVSCVEGVSTLK